MFRGQFVHLIVVGSRGATAAIRNLGICPGTVVPVAIRIALNGRDVREEVVEGRYIRRVLGIDWRGEVRSRVLLFLRRRTNIFSISRRTSLRATASVGRTGYGSSVAQGVHDFGD